MEKLTPLEKFQKGWKDGNFDLLCEGTKELKDNGYTHEDIKAEMKKIFGN